MGCLVENQTNHLGSKSNFGMQANSVDSESSNLICLHTVCYRDVLNGLADDTANDIKSRLAAEELIEP